MTAIVKAYVTLIRESRRTIESVPAQIRAEVEKALGSAE